MAVGTTTAAGAEHPGRAAVWDGGRPADPIICFHRTPRSHSSYCDGGKTKEPLMLIPVTTSVISGSADATSTYVDAATQPLDMTLYLEFPDE